MFVNVRKALKRRSGFSLLEMLAVAVVIGVLALIAVPAVLNAEAGSKDAACDANRDQIINAFTTYKARNGNTINTSEVNDVKTDLVTNGYISNEGLQDPDGGDPYTITITPLPAAANTAYGAAYSIKVECPNTPDHGDDQALF
ncbi:MAG: competence type IV pilus major pilin ComGC [Armatimonadota bacterium]